MVCQHLHGGADVGDRARRCDGLDLQPGCRLRGALPGAQVDREAGFVGHDVGACAAHHSPDVDVHAAPATVQAVECDGLVGCLEDRAAALLRLHACVGGSAVDPDAQVGHPGSGRDDGTVGARGFQDQGGTCPVRQLGDEGPLDA